MELATKLSLIHCSLKTRYVILELTKYPQKGVTIIMNNGEAPKINPVVKVVLPFSAA